MLDKRALIISVCFVGAMALGFGFIPESDLKDTFVFILAFTVGALVFWITRDKMSTKEKEIRNKIDQLKNEGQDLKYEQEIALTTQDFEILRKKRLIHVIIMAVALLLIGSIAILSIHFLVELQYKILIEVAVAVVLVVLFWYSIRINLKKNNEAVQKGTKTVVRGIVTDKRIEGDETDNYILEIENLAIDVKKDVYSTYQVGDGIEIHILKNYYNTILYKAKIESMNLK